MWGQLLGVGLFVVVCGGLTLLIGVLCLGGLAVARRQRRAQTRRATDQGWRGVGGDRYEGEQGSAHWRGGWEQDSDSGACWTDFTGHVPDFPRGGFMLLSQRAWRDAQADVRGERGDQHPADQRADWPPLTVGSEQFNSSHLMFASDPRWAAVWTPEIETLWLKAQVTGELQARAQHGALHLKRDDGKAEPTQEQVFALLRLGQALLQAIQTTIAQHDKSGGGFRAPIA